MQLANDVGPHVHVRGLVAPLGHAAERLLARTLAGEVGIALHIVVLGVLGSDVGGDVVVHHPVEHLAGAESVVAHDLVVAVPQRQADVLVHDVDGIHFLAAVLQEQLRIVAGHVAGVLFVLIVGLGLGEDDARAHLLSAQRSHRAGIAGADDEHIAAVSGVHVLEGGHLTEPRGHVVHEIGRSDAQRVAAGGELQRAVAGLHDEVLRRGGSHRALGHVAVEVGHLCHHVVAGARLGHGGLSGGAGLGGAGRRAAGQCAEGGHAHGTGSGALQEITAGNAFSHCFFLSIAFPPPAPPESDRLHDALWEGVARRAIGAAVPEDGCRGKPFSA